MRRFGVVLGVLLAAGLLAEPAAAGRQRSLVIVTRDASVTRIGTFRPSENPRLSAAIRAFGRPSSRRGSGDTSCRVHWSRLGLRMLFVNLGAPGRSACGRSVGKAQSFTARGSRFRTVAGLRVGMPSSEVRARHPRARHAVGAWTLVRARSPYGDGTEIPVLRAFTKDGTVTVLAGWIGGAGD